MMKKNIQVFEGLWFLMSQIVNSVCEWWCKRGWERMVVANRKIESDQVTNKREHSSNLKIEKNKSVVELVLDYGSLHMKMLLNSSRKTEGTVNG